jgi:hypothetical protein
MICPLSRNEGNTAGVSCKETCQWWDKDAKQCNEQTKKDMLVSIYETLYKMADTLVLMQRTQEYGTGQTVSDET